MAEFENFNDNEFDNNDLTNSENNEPTVNTVDDSSSKKQSKSVQTNDSDTLAVLNSLLLKWNESVLPVAWMTKSQLQELATQYSSLLMNRNTTGASRGKITSGLRRLDDEIDLNIEHIKNRLQERLGSRNEALSRFREFGIVKEKSYKLPLSREHRLLALKMLIDALGVYQFQDTNYNIEYWTAINNEYETLLNQARATDGTVSSKVGTLNGIRSKVKKFQTNFKFIVRGNYPDTWKNELRDFGFQKEKY
jgi:hypothetical protein